MMEAFPMSWTCWHQVKPLRFEKLRITDATDGLPEIVVTDNWFEDFLEKNGIRYIRTAPCHPASNGLADRAVQTSKEGLKNNNRGTVETRISRFLARQRSPSEKRLLLIKSRSQLTWFRHRWPLKSQNFSWKKPWPLVRNPNTANWTRAVCSPYRRPRKPLPY